MEVNKEISPSKKYCFPHPLKTVEFRGKTIVISPETANWIVLENKEQVDFYCLLQSKTIEEALELFQGNRENAEWVVIQLEARRFEDLYAKKMEHKLYMQFHLTNSCNMKCPHCYMYSGDKKEEELSLDEIFQLLERFRAAGGEGVNFTGGEIRMRKDLFLIVEHAHRLGLSIRLLTNGTMWTETDIKKISPYIDRVQISIDGYSEEENAKIRGKGSFQKAMYAVKTFLDYDVPTDVGITPWFDEHLEHKYLEYGKFGRTLKEQFRDKPFSVRYTRELIDGREIRFSDLEKEKYLRIVDEIYLTYWGEDNLDEPFINFHRDKRLENNCDYGNLTIESNGNVFFCPAISMQPTSVNVRTHTFEEILSISERARIVSDVTNLTPCKDCHLKYICGGGCRIKYFEAFREEEPHKIKGTPHRRCTNATKEAIYEQMIRTNTRLFQ